MSLHKALAFLLAGGMFLSACKKPVLEETGLIPEDYLKLRYTDTLTVVAWTVLEDSALVGNGAFCPLGIMTDPDFGKTEVSFYMPFTLPEDNLTLEDSIQELDSIVLTLRYSSVYGEWRDPQTIRVFEMTEGIDDSLDYYSNQLLSYSHVEIGRVDNFLPNMTDTLDVNGGKVPPSLRIKLDNDWGQKFIDASGTSHYANNESFREFFKGLYIAPSVSDLGQGLVIFNPNSTFCELRIYYHDPEDSTFSYRFPATSLSVVNHYEHDYTGTIVNDYIGSNADTVIGDSIIFIQGLSGVNTKFKVPHLKNLGNILVNKAELVVTQIPFAGKDSVFKVPEKLILVKQEDGKFTAITDQSPSEIAGGNKVIETDSASGEKFIRYRFSVARYNQEVITEDSPDFGIFIIPNARYQDPHRLIAGGGNHSQYQLKLNLTYTVIE